LGGTERMMIGDKERRKEAWGENGKKEKGR
jgi:hypothetical protein